MSFEEKKKKLWMEQITHDASDAFNILNISSDFLEEKAWGWKYNLVNSFFWSLDICWVIKGGYCSKHYHEMKANRFCIITGELEISWYSDNKKTWTHRMLSPKDDSRSQDIFPGVLHQFHAHTDCVFIEYENAKFSRDDIFRESEGGVE